MERYIWLHDRFRKQAKDLGISIALLAYDCRLTLTGCGCLLTGALRIHPALTDRLSQRLAIPVNEILEHQRRDDAERARLLVNKLRAIANKIEEAGPDIMTAEPFISLQEEPETTTWEYVITAFANE